jgi:hypothetical protein
MQGDRTGEGKIINFSLNNLTSPAKHLEDTMKYPMKICSTRTEPDVPADGNLTFLKLVEHFLTPEEIKQAVEAGRADHDAALAAKVKKRSM